VEGFGTSFDALMPLMHVSTRTPVVLVSYVQANI
jgi:hypothetical protein